MNKMTLYQHFETMDHIMAVAVRQVDPQRFPKPKDRELYFEQLCGAIIGQQLSGRVADVIEARFRTLLNGHVRADVLLKLSDQQLRDAGMSWAKVRSLKDLAEKTVQKEIVWEKLSELDDEAVIQELTKVKGIGRWTAEMFLIFTLGREDVFSFGDLGLKKGLLKIYNLPSDVSKEKISAIVTPWSPYRSYASLALWRALE